MSTAEKPKRRRRKPRASSTSHPATWFVEWVRGGVESDSGIAINGATALTYAYVFQAVNVIAADIAGLPVEVYARAADDTRSRDRTHPAWWLLNEDAAPWMSGRTLRETLTAHALAYGNGYGLITREMSGVPVRITPLLPDRTEPIIVAGQLRYRTRLDDGSQPEYDAADVLHIKGLGYDGIRGYSVITLARNSWGLGLAMEKHGNRHFRNNARPGVILKHPRALDEPEARRLLAGWDARHAGGDNRDRTALLTGGMEAVVLPISNDDAQWLETRKFQRSEVAAWFNLPPHKLGDESRTSYNSLEIEEQAYLNTTLKHWLDRWEDECQRKLLTERQRRGQTHYIEHNIDDRLRPDTKARYSVYEIGIRNRIISPNEARKRENLPPYEGGDTYANPNTTSGQQAEPPPNDAAQAAHRSLLMDTAAFLLDVESQRATSMAGKPGEFVDAMEAFYSDVFPGVWMRRMRSVLAAASSVMPIAMSAEEALEWHVAASKKRLLHVAGYSYADDLRGNIKKEVGAWESRAAELVTAIIEGPP